MKETRKLYSMDVRTLCIKNKWYTRGTCDEYEKMFNYINSCEDFKTENIVYVAKDIKDHSDTEQGITSICAELARICYNFFDEDEFDPCNVCGQPDDLMCPPCCAEKNILGHFFKD